MSRVSKKLKDRKRWRTQLPPARKFVELTLDREEQLEKKFYVDVALILHEQYGIKKSVARYAAEKKKESWRSGVSGKSPEEVAKKLVKKCKKAEKKWRTKGLF
jgi:hypothetical protein